MDQIEFADGFDRPDTIAFGLGAGQLAVVMVGALVAYSLVRSPLPPAIADPVAAVLALGAAGLGWLRVAGRSALDWAVFAGLFYMRPRRGTVRWEVVSANSSDGAAPVEGEPPRASILELFGKRTPGTSGSNTPPPARGQKTPSAQPPGDRNRSRVMRPTSRADGARRVTFFSLRGGTGRSTLATELTCLLAASHSEQRPAPKVALVDLDLRSPSVAVRLGAPERTLLDYALAPPENRSVIDFMVSHASGALVLLGPHAE